MAELNIKERQAGDITILDMNGKVTIGEGSVALRGAIRRLLEEGKKKILLNLGGVGYGGSGGAGFLGPKYQPFSVGRDGRLPYFTQGYLKPENEQRRNLSTV